VLTACISIKPWLNTNCRYIVADGVSLSSCEVTSGVPQGSALEPTLFYHILANDLVLDIQSTVDHSQMIVWYITQYVLQQIIIYYITRSWYTLQVSCYLVNDT